MPLPSPPQIGEAWGNKSRWQEWMKTLQSGRNRYEALRRESSKQNLAKSSVPGQQAGSGAGAQLRKAAAFLYFYSCKEFFTPLKIIAPPAFSKAVTLLTRCSLFSPSTQKTNSSNKKCKHKTPPLQDTAPHYQRALLPSESGCHRLTFTMQFLFLCRVPVQEKKILVRKTTV